MSDSEKIRIVDDKEVNLKILINLSEEYDIDTGLALSQTIQTVLRPSETFNIITEGYGRTMPEHFDPAILRAFV